MAFRNEMNQPIPQEQGAAQPSFWEWLRSPNGLAMVGGIGAGLQAKMQNVNQPAMPVAMAEMERGQEEAKKQLIAQKLSDPNFLNDPNARKELAKVLFSMGDPKSMELATKLAFPDQESSFGAPIAVVDPATGQQKYVQVNKAGVSRDVPGITPIHRYDTPFQKAEARLQDTLIKANNLKSPEDANEAIDAYSSGKLVTASGKPLKPLTPSQYNVFSAYMKQTSDASSLSKATSANTAHAEIEAAKPFLDAVYKDYGTTWAGIQPDALIDQFKNDDKSQEKLGRLFAANTVSNALANAINRVDFGEAGEGAVHRILDESRMAIDTKLMRVSGKAREAAFKEMTRIQRAMISTRNKYGVGAAGAIGIPMQQGESSPTKQSWKVVNGQLVEG